MCLLGWVGVGVGGMGWWVVDSFEGVEMSEPLMLETEEEVTVPADLRWALKVFLYGCSHNSHHC